MPTSRDWTGTSPQGLSRNWNGSAIIQKPSNSLKHPPKDLKGIQKYRIGDYRILLWVDHKERQITLYGVEHRRSVYDDL